jgi:hypothetical protein
MEYIARQIAGRMHVADSNRAVIRAARSSLTKDARQTTDPARVASRKEFYRLCLQQHRENQDLVRYYRF